MSTYDRSEGSRGTSDSTSDEAREKLEEEVGRLREQLREAEAVLDAIRFDRVDALVISDPEGDRVRTIESIGVIANSIFDQVVQPVFVLDEDHRILRANPAAVTLAGRAIESEDLKEVLPLSPIPEGEKEAPQVEVLPANWIREGRKLVRREVGYVQSDGTSRYFLMEANVFFLPRESFRGGIVTLVDITAEKRAEIELAVRNAQLSYQFDLTTAITDNAAEALVLLDELGRVMFLNPAAERLFGCEHGELNGRTLGDRVSIQMEEIEETGLEEERTGDPVEAVRISRAELHIQATLERWDGERIPVQGSIAPVRGDGGRLTGSVLVLRDVSDLREAEEALRASEEMQRQSQKLEAIGLLAGGIAHDFNNLLTAIVGYADLLALMADAGTPEHEYASEIQRAGSRAAELTSQLLAFGRKQMRTSTSLNLNTTIEEVEKMLRRVTGAKLEIITNLAPDLGLIRADPIQVEQVLLNLAVNARDAMPEGGPFHIRTANVEWSGDDPLSPLTDLDPGPFVLLSVRDRGVGMDVPTRERIFEPFFSTKGKTRSGLGLSTVYGIVHQNGGRIAVHSEPGSGTEFKLYFPRVESDNREEARVPPASPATAARGTETILMAEDEDTVRRLVLKVLESRGYTVLVARSGREALDIEEAYDARIHLLLTDVVMPGMGGRELARAVAQRREGVKIAFMSGFTDDAVFSEESSAGGGRLIRKPFSAETLARFVREALDSEAVVP
jgi:two-component system, cell cycle sensor histidine kinase and response regulator CckA